MKVKPHHPLVELLAQCLHGIECIPPKAIVRAKNDAIRAALKWYLERHPNEQPEKESPRA